MISINWLYVIIVNYVGSLIFLLVGTYIDTWLFENPITRESTIENFNPDAMDHKEIFWKFFKCNLRELILWLGGFTSGMIVMLFYLGVSMK
jgi:formate/nitrite transporter FocA (FNT family)